MLFSFWDRKSRSQRDRTKCFLTFDTAEKNITGVVLDAKTNEPVINATIQVKGTTTGVITDIDGKFNISCSSENTLVISFIGYTSQEIKVGKIPSSPSD